MGGGSWVLECSPSNQETDRRLTCELWYIYLGICVSYFMLTQFNENIYTFSALSVTLQLNLKVT